MIVKEIKGDRISLTLQETVDREAEAGEIQDFRDQDGDQLGSLGDVLGGFKL